MPIYDTIILLQKEESMAFKKCTQCGRIKTTNEFSKRSDTGKLRSNCKECVSKGNLKRYHNGGKELQAVRARKSLLKKYGITEEFYQKEREAQKHCCKICGKHESNQKHGKLYVDHCHETELYRGLLCNSCNTGLGSFRDNEELMLKAIEYVKENRIRHRNKQ